MNKAIDADAEVATVATVATKERSPPVRSRRNAGMATWLLLTACGVGIVGVALLKWTPIVLLMAPVFLLGGLGYAIMGASTPNDDEPVDR